ncbi:hypothetical protein ASE36_11055 [Rhizobium sp. Root274]|uniref:hypothetical protein n=1 Tax=unclassified Rhizobium TaxID=2613769 RepID=UPI000715BF0F|nr:MULTISPECIES: hypothetical protein [unclassified Rhizobium]KQW29008.1 hypothetical protein ASC71_11075 [Rhizobium sp. Root1240]KRD29204.1 hypothetical protein ASE36_11055 [Rhizobium sp. Root274]
MSIFSNLKRDKSDPTVVSKGPSSFSSSDRLARNLGWFSIGLGLVELFAAHRLTRTLGMEGQETMVQAAGLREIGTGMMTLSVDKELGLASRLAGDGIDVVTLGAAMHADNPKQDNVAIALVLVAGVTLLDFIAAGAARGRHTRRLGEVRDFSDRSGFPRGVAGSRGLAREKSKAMEG